MKYIILQGGIDGESVISLETGKNFSHEINKIVYAESATISPSREVEILNPNGVITTKFNKEKEFYYFLKENNYGVINALHGKFGEDGTIQKILNKYKITFTGPSAESAGITFNKYNTQKFVREIVITPKTIKITKHSHIDINAINKRLGDYPYIIKPNRGGSSIGVDLIRNKNQLASYLSNINTTVLLQEFIRGREFSIGSINFDNKFWDLPITEIMPEGEFFDFKNKYTKDIAREITPANIPINITAKIKKTAINIHSKLDLGVYARHDFILKGNDIYFLEVNSLPGFTSNSIVPQQLKAVGKYDLFFKTLVEKLSLP